MMDPGCDPPSMSLLAPAELPALTIQTWDDGDKPPPWSNRDAEPGPVEMAVRADLERLGRLDEGVRGSLAEMALRMARAYDGYDGADITKLARVNMELRQTLCRIAEVGDDGDGGEAARMSTPVRDAAESGPADAGAADGGGRGEAR